MSKLQKNQHKQEVFIHHDDIIKYIAKDLNINYKKISFITHQKSVIANESNNFQHKAFEKLTVIFKNQEEQLTKEISKEQLIALIAKNLDIESQFLDFQYFCNPKPGSNGLTQLNYIGVTNNNQQHKISLHTTFNKIEQIRKHSLSTSTFKEHTLR